MKVETDKPYKLIYSLFEHQYLGLLFESFVVQLNDKGEYTFSAQNISSQNIQEFNQGIDEKDVLLVKLMDSIQQAEIIKRFNKKKKVPAFEFFNKVFGDDRKDVILENAILSHTEKYRSEILKNLAGKDVFIMGKDGYPAWKPIEVVDTPAQIYFHFDRKDEETYYYPIVKCKGEKVKFQFKGALLLAESPTFLLLENKLYTFEDHIDGKKIKPFLEKSNIVIPRKIEANYFNNFVKPLVASYNVYANGFTIKTVNTAARSVLKIREINKVTNGQTDLFSSNEDAVVEKSILVFDLGFYYGDNYFSADSYKAKANVKLEKDNDSWLFTKIPRHIEFEKKQADELKKLGLPLSMGRLSLEKNKGFSWLQKNAENLKLLNIEVDQDHENNKKYFVGTSTFDLVISEKNDWFDIKATIRFGEYEIPFLKIRNLILQNISEFVLPNGDVAVIPSEWFATYPDLFQYSFLENDELKLEKQFVGMVQDLSDSGIAKTVLSKKLEGLRNFSSIEEIALPKGLKGELRPYQKAGYDWMHFLKNYRFGGCLADDMGLGKTVVTLAFLQSLKEENSKTPSLIVMPTSLVFNWQKEAEKFTPDLKVYVHIGSNRIKSPDIFAGYDLVIMSYGILRIDIDFVRTFNFNYFILDESQAIKNPNSLIAKTVGKVSCYNRLILTGTPLENNTIDLWSQYSFINPGLLGSYNKFKDVYQNEIEKKNNEEAGKKLYAKIKPFMLRRSKAQVAKELPEKVETLVFCQMSEEQESIYEETKSAFRNSLLDGEKGNAIRILEGLTKLRQIANNPKIVDESYEGTSGKEDDVMFKLKEVVESGSKVLVFSQFVTHLTLFRENLDKQDIPYLYLDGSTKNRQNVVEEFQENDDYQVFLISLKAGGVGLNLTAAEYVFILDPWWNPAVEAQAIDRAHRIGQTKTVFIYKFISKNSVEEKIVGLQEDKKKLFDQLISSEASFSKSLNQADLVALLE